MEVITTLKYKQLDEVGAGEFRTPEGEIIKYDASYKLKADEITSRGIQERVFKFPKTNIELRDKLVKIPPYTDIKLRMDIQLFSSGNAKVVPLELLDDTKSSNQK